MIEAPKKLCKSCEPFGECLFLKEAGKNRAKLSQPATPGPGPLQDTAARFNAYLKTRETEAFPNCPNKTAVGGLFANKTPRETALEKYQRQNS